MSDSRQFVHELVAILDPGDGRPLLRAPAPGLWRGAPEPGTLVRPGAPIGELEQLGVLHRLRAPEGAEGIVVAESPRVALARRPVDRGALLLTLDPEALAGGLAVASSVAGPASEGALVFRSPSAGRFYVRAAPDKPAFVEVGQVIGRGQTIGVLEVMKTFTRIQYDDPRLPERAKIAAIVVRDQDEIDAGAVLLELEVP
ncbi:biotin/lipoyl-containing protein [Nannocystaceae bacterium ST9]